MTAYLVWRKQPDGALTEMVEVDTRSPERAVKEVAQKAHDATGAENGSYFAALKSATANVTVSVQPSVRIAIDSDREIKSRKQADPVTA